MLTHLSLFSGIGGLDLAAEAAGFTTVGQCEWADYPTKVLEKHWPDVPRWRDIRTLTKESFYEKTGLRTVDVISGGFPCQPFSVAGKQKAKDDDRYLWPEMLRVIRELAPRWVIGENVPGIIRLAAWDVVSDLEREGFDAVVFDFEAAAVGALHRRERIAFVGNAKRDGRATAEITGIVTENCERCAERKNTPVESEGAGRRNHHEALANTGSEGLQRLKQHGAFDAGERQSESCGSTGERCETVFNAKCARLEKRDGERMGQPEKYQNSQSASCEALRGRTINRSSQWAVEPDVGRVAHGVPNRVDRLKCLGNAVVPQQFYPIFAAIAEIEKDNA